jgi:hypothetical protein
MELKIIASLILEHGKYEDIFWRPHYVPFDGCVQCQEDKWCMNICSAVLWQWVDILSNHEGFTVEDESIQGKMDELSRISRGIRCMMTRNSAYGTFEGIVPPNMDAETFRTYFLHQLGVSRHDENMRQSMGKIAYLYYNVKKNTLS